MLFPYNCNNVAVVYIQANDGHFNTVIGFYCDFFILWYCSLLYQGGLCMLGEKYFSS